MWLQEAGYNTYYTGKLFNAHSVRNYDSPFPAGWNQSVSLTASLSHSAVFTNMHRQDFLLDPYTYMYLNATYQRNQDPPVSWLGHHTVDVLRSKALSFLDEAASHASTTPFFLGIAPIAPHSNVVAAGLDLLPGDDPAPPLIPPPAGLVGPPIPAVRHRHLFQGLKVPRTANFNPDKPTGAHWIRKLPKLDAVSVAWNDHFYRQRLRALQGVDELVEDVVQRLEALGLLDNTYVIYTTDNGYHLSQHRLRPGKECGFDEDINVPLIVRGPGVPEGLETDVVTTHVDLAPTILKLAGAGRKLKDRADDFDGVPLPLTGAGLAAAREGGEDARHEHVTVEFWGLAVSEGGLGNDYILKNNTYKAVRIVAEKYSLYYSVWCTNEHELYDLKVSSVQPPSAPRQAQPLETPTNPPLPQTDPSQVTNLLNPLDNPSPSTTTLLGAPLSHVAARLDSLLFVLKSCRGPQCVRPWASLHPAGNVASLADALSPRFDAFYLEQQKKVGFSACEAGYLLDAEGPQWDGEGVAFRDGVRWSEWV